MSEPFAQLLPDQRRKAFGQLMASQYDRPTYYDQAPVGRAGLLPLGTYPNGQTGLAFPGFVTEPVESWNRMLTAASNGERPSPEDSFNVAGAAMVGGYAAPKPVNALGSAGGRLNAMAETPGIRAFHGSPHDFDKFDLSKIGTGEGAQAYGHGLYFAENEGVAKSYRDSVGKPSMLTDQSQSMAERILTTFGGDYDTAIRIMGQQGDTGTVNALEKMRADGVKASPPGRMYEVNIKADPNDFLDWDKPLSQQSEKVKEGLRRTWKPGSKMDAMTGYETFDNAARRDGNAGGVLSPERWPEEFSDQLHRNGIPGIRYLDQGSRSAGEGTSNYVVFDDSLVDILRKYGLAGLTAGGAATNLLGQYPSQPQQQSKPWWDSMRDGDL